MPQRSAACTVVRPVVVISGRAYKSASQKGHKEVSLRKDHQPSPVVQRSAHPRGLPTWTDRSPNLLAAPPAPTPAPTFKVVLANIMASRLVKGGAAVLSFALLAVNSWGARTLPMSRILSPPIPRWPCRHPISSPTMTSPRWGSAWSAAKRASKAPTTI